VLDNIEAMLGPLAKGIVSGAPPYFEAACGSRQRSLAVALLDFSNARKKSM
jgi:hypothetical protein